MRNGRSGHPLYARPFLLLDVREQEAFLRSHLVLAESYPVARLNRSPIVSKLWALVQITSRSLSSWFGEVLSDPFQVL